MSNNTDYFTNPKNHPDNAHLPTLNQPATILGITIAFLVCGIPELSMNFLNISTNIS